MYNDTDVLIAAKLGIPFYVLRDWSYGIGKKT